MRNILINEFSQRLINCLVDGGHAGTVDDIINSIGQRALGIQLEELRKVKMYISPYDDIISEQLDSKGVSRFRLGISELGACMVPDREGYWTRAQQ